MHLVEVRDDTVCVGFSRTFLPCPKILLGLFTVFQFQVRLSSHHHTQMALVGTQQVHAPVLLD